MVDQGSHFPSPGTRSTSYFQGASPLQSGELLEQDPTGEGVLIPGQAGLEPAQMLVVGRGITEDPLVMPMRYDAYPHAAFSILPASAGRVTSQRLSKRSGKRQGIEPSRP